MKKSPVTLKNLLNETTPCAEVGGEVFYTESGEYSAFVSSVQKIKNICGRCEIIEACLDFALDNPEATKYGIYGGKTESERRAIKRSTGRS